MNYNRILYDIFHMKPAPKHLIADFIEYPEGYFAVRLYRDNFDSLPESTRVAATEWAMETLTNLNKIAPCGLEAWETPPEDK